MKSIIVTFFAVFAVPLGLTLYTVVLMLNHRYFGPLKHKRRLTRHPQNKLGRLGHGFKLINEQYYSGIYDRYLVNIGYNWNSRYTFSKPCIWIDVFFTEDAKHKDTGTSLPFDPDLNYAKGIQWSKGSLYSELSYYFFPPGLGAISKQIKASIKTLRKHGFEPRHEVEMPVTYTNQNWLNPWIYIKKVIAKSLRRS